MWEQKSPMAMFTLFCVKHLIINDDPNDQANYDCLMCANLFLKELHDCLVILGSIYCLMFYSSSRLHMHSFIDLTFS